MIAVLIISANCSTLYCIFFQPLFIRNPPRLAVATMMITLQIKPPEINLNPILLDALL